jgi:RimJ/RimL family protein N-acetyltransferase
VAPATLTTPRLVIRPLVLDDAPFIVTLLNDPDFIRFIGDRKVRTIDDARRYLTAGPLASYADHGFGLCAVTLVASGAPIGICGLLQRAVLPGPDLGFAFLAHHRGEGYAFEAAAAVHADARTRLGIDPLFAIVNPDNTPSVRLLEKLGFAPVGATRLAGDTADVALYAARAQGPEGADPKGGPKGR